MGVFVYKNSINAKTALAGRICISQRVIGKKQIAGQAFQIKADGERLIDCQSGFIGFNLAYAWPGIALWFAPYFDFSYKSSAIMPLRLKVYKVKPALKHDARVTKSTVCNSKEATLHTSVVNPENVALPFMAVS